MNLYEDPINGDKIKIGLKRHEKNKTYVAKDATTTGATTKTYGEIMASQHNLEYKGIVSVGTPPQQFEVVFDTGSDIFWLPQIGCQSYGVDVHACASGQELYNPNASSTSGDIHRAFQIQYGTGSANGRYYDDMLSFGDATTSSYIAVGNVTLGAAQQMTFSDQGILGLSFAAQNDPTPVFQLAAQRNVFDEPEFTVYLMKCSHNCDEAGLITFGGFDDEHCEAVIGGTNLIEGVPYWMFNLDNISVNGKTYSNQKAIVDTGTSVIIGPQSAAVQLIRQIGARSVGDGNYVMDCSAQFSLDFTINGQQYSVNSDQLLLSQGFGMCNLAISYDPGVDFWILGDPFLRQYCTVHNVVNKTVQFAPSKSATKATGGGNGGTSGGGNGGNGEGKGGTGGGHRRPHGGHGNKGQGNFPFGSPFGNQDPFSGFPQGGSFGQPFSSGGPYDPFSPFGTSLGDPFGPGFQQGNFGGNAFSGPNFGGGPFGSSPYGVDTTESKAKIRVRKDKTEQYNTGRDKTVQDRTGQDRTGQDKTKQNKTKQNKTGQDRTGQGRKEQDRTGQDKTGQGKTGQDRTRQDKTR
ncbi:unnamed protein product [Bursaphelenchus okinawaensis]|uniref:Peptidase A1 domain-containing protein n=1 Tax=Bursaphelenchus okinawaensis TaxID=465554 RepID=A0A811KZA8_9BILA|nr:unnamed protein product [Bursaphelenchus okinawaensis]CAG9114140.1 unnamed protein product [Bursaphelenchus okinawaensis]